MTEKTEFDEKGNRACATSFGSRITTVEQLIGFCEIDLATWEVERSIVNKWEVGAKDTDGNIVVEPLFQVKVWLVKKSPEPLTPVIQAVKISGFARGLPSMKTAKRKRAMVIFDPHFGFSRNIHTNELTPFHDRAALSIIMQFATHYRPDVAVWGGDILDLPDWSDKFLRSPEMYNTTQPAVIEAAWVIAHVARFCKENVVMAGNHDARLHNSLLTHFAQAYDLKPANTLKEPPPMSIEKLLGLEQMGVQYVGDYPNGRYKIADDTIVVHGDATRAAGGATASAMLERENTSILFGHIHRAESVGRTIWDGDTPNFISGICPGCVCRVDGFVPGSTKNGNWQQGFAFVEFSDNYQSTINVVNINAGQAYLGGRYFVAENYLPQLNELDYFKGAEK